MEPGILANYNYRCEVGMTTSSYEMSRSGFASGVALIYDQASLNYVRLFMMPRA
jgi:hypothetical protein